MRAVMTKWCIPSLRSMILALGGILISTATSIGSDGQASRQERFRILFPPGAAMPFEIGDYAERNRVALAEMARILGLWSSQTGVRFLFVAPSTASCTAQSGCSPQQLMWQRVNAAMVRVKEIAAKDGSRLRFDVVRFAFSDELDFKLRLAEAPAGSEAIDLRTDADKRVPADGDCPGRILLFDPDLPPAIGEIEGKPIIPVSGGSSLVVGRQTMVRATLGARSGEHTVAVWENDRGEFRNAAPSVFSVEGAELPQHNVRLHLLDAQPEDSELQRFRVALRDAFKAINPLPAALQGQRSKGLGDDVLMLPPGGVEPQQPEGSSALHCHATFLTAPSASSDSSR